ncbi:NDMA-dependent alcohol dehydrogenase [Blastococcus sp. Marseille-P5729]|uniref:NDMA-dependent alcohol dehydrogenase n=1 Tax=Blastococcus sp. Marseille-P5729 TaxID=2086582 RepID=UPI000D0F2968|nr:NDMA-dependent alcohol dehydrogenase [Blastococcus sp. Marseille-P5729]
MKVQAAVLGGIGQDWEIREIEVGDPVANEVQVKLTASGLCHSDEHVRTGSSPVPFFPVVGGHEGAGVITKVGPGVVGLEEGDHVVLSFIPACGKCRMCAKGLQNLCDLGAGLVKGKAISDKTFRYTIDGEPAIPFCLLGTFSPYVTVHEASVVKIEKDIPLDKAALLGCGVSTGWGSATEIGGTKAGDTVVVMGCGGIGINAVQGAAAAGARFVVAVDPVDFKREKAMELGATHAYASIEEAMGPVGEMTWGTLADVTVIAVGEISGEHIQPACQITGKGGTVVVTGMGDFRDGEVKLNLFELTLLQKNLQGAIFGGIGPRQQIPQLLNMYRAGLLKLDELVTTEYSLAEINQGYQDMNDGKNIRGIIRYTDEDYAGAK